MKRSTIVLATSMLICACTEKQSTTEPIDQLTPEVFADIMTDAGKLEPTSAEKDVILETWAEEDQGFRYTYEKHDAVDNLENVTYLGLNDDVIWPGSLVRGEKAYSWVYEPIIVPRKPITLSLSLEGAGFGVSRVVNDPRLSTVRAGIADLVSQAFGQQVSVPAQADFDYRQVFSTSDMSLFVGADVSYGAGSLTTTFDWSETSTTNKIVAKYTQVYFSVDMDTPASARDLFGESITAAQLRGAIPAGSKPLYVSSVKYGLMVLMLIETHFSAERMDAALSAAWDSGVDVELDFGYSAREVLDQSSIRFIIYGGSTAGIQELDGDAEAFEQIIKKSADFTPASPGVPLLYKFRHVRDNTLTLITLTSQYTLVRPLRLQQWIRVRSRVVIMEWQYDDDPFYDWQIDMDRLHILVNAFNRTGTNDPGVQFNPVNQPLVDWGTADYVEFTGEFPAVGVVDLAFDAEHFDWNFARLVINANARDYDWASGDEWGYGSTTLTGNEMLGEHSFKILSADFTLRVLLLITPEN
jgi:hypothetical protein